jgi:hypothetical protein
LKERRRWRRFCFAAAGRRRTGVVYQHVYPSGGTQNAGDCRLDRRFVDHVDLYRLDAQLLELAKALQAPSGGKDAVAALCFECFCERLSDPRAASRDEHNLHRCAVCCVPRSSIEEAPLLLTCVVVLCGGSAAQGKAGFGDWLDVSKKQTDS